MPEPRCNVADRLTALAAARPAAIAVVEAKRGGYRTITFGELERDATLLARGLVAMGVKPGDRIALLVRPGIEFVTLVFALLRSGATLVLVDAGLGRQNILRCLAMTEPQGFVAIPLAHALRIASRRFPQAKLNVTVGRRWFWGGETLASLRKLGAADAALPHTAADDHAAIVFTSGSTGPPKGVLYRHETFVTQADEIQRQYGIEPGGVDLACFPLFGLFNVSMGVTTVVPEMDFSRPAAADPKKLLRAANDWKVTQAFASPAVWRSLSAHCERTGERIPTLQNVFSCGAPVPAKVIRRTLACVHPEAKLHTPYGATEALPIATIEAQEILTETAAKTDQGAGVCVGRKFDSIEWRVIRIRDDAIATIGEAEELPVGEIGELIVRGPQVSMSYLWGFNDLAKINDGATDWHRVGDVGYFDEQERFWYCGRKSQRVVTSVGTLFTECVEAQYNTLPLTERTALVGVGAPPNQIAVVVVEPTPLDKIKNLTIGGLGDALKAADSLGATAENPPPQPIEHILIRSTLPTDIRHNSKIQREKLAVWAEKQLTKQRRRGRNARG